MNITELDSFKLSDAVKFNDKLNSRIWDSNEKMLPQVRERLLKIAEDFKEFLGIDDLSIKDITLSGSNAAYTYTPHSDIDLHLIADLPEADINEVFRELFDAKKYQYNNQHNIKIGGYDVELYVQDANKPVVSSGEYSVLNDRWLQIPRRIRSEVDHASVRSKYEHLKSQIESAVKSGDADIMAALTHKIKKMRQAGLDKHGEFGAENLAFKILRTQGLIKKLYDARNAAKDRALSLDERRKKKTKKKIKYGFGGYWYPGTAYAGQDHAAGSESVEENFQPTTINSELEKFIQFCVDNLKIKQSPKLIVQTTPEWSEDNHSFGQYNTANNTLTVSVSGRHPMDVMRTVAHELVHQRQAEIKPLPNDAGKDGSKYENQANALAGVLLRRWGRKNPELFNTVMESSGYIPTEREKNDPRFIMALSPDVRPGATGKEANKLKLKTDAQGHPGLLIKDLKNALREFKESNKFTLFENKSIGDIIDLTANYPAFDKMQGKIIGSESGKLIIKIVAVEPVSKKMPVGTILRLAPNYLRRAPVITEEEDLLEVSMSPSNLKRLAADIDARVGMEFEMIIPNLRSEDEDFPDMEANYDEDESTRSFSNIENFFSDYDYNSRRDVERTIERLREEFFESLDDRLYREFDDDSFTIVYDYVVDNISDTDIIDSLDLSDEDIERFNNDPEFRSEKINEYVDQAFKNDWAVVDEARSDWMDTELSNADERDWLRENYPYMSDIENNFELMWPHWDPVRAGEGEIDGQAIADDFENVIGKPVNYSSSYHGGRREPGHYVVEPDGSLDGDSPDDAGLEFVSPPMTLEEMAVDLKKIKEWAAREGVYTNRSTGLHMNVSVPDLSTAKLDYVKLALMLGDKYILDQYNRLSNNYAKSAMDIIAGNIKSRPEAVAAVMEKMRNRLDALATKILHTGETSKYTSINTKGNYVEFRGPGGDWLSEDTDKLLSTLRRFVVALDASIHPDKYRKEYAKKLYKMLATDVPEEFSSVIELFANFSAGELNKSELIQKLRQKQLQRKIARGGTSNEPGDGEPTQIGGSQRYEIYKADSGQVINRFWAADHDMAREIALKWLTDNGLTRSGHGVRVMATNDLPVGLSSEGEIEYEIIDRDTRHRIGDTFKLASDGQAMVRLNDYRNFGNHGLSSAEAARRFTVRRVDAIEPGEHTGTAGTGENFTGNWGLWMTNANRFARAPGQLDDNVLRRYPSREAAEAALAQAREQNPRVRSDIEIREIEPTRTPVSDINLFPELEPAQPIPGSTLDLQRQRLERSSGNQIGQTYTPTGTGEFTGNWLVLNPENQIIYRFGGVGNSQSDANRIAMQWLRQNPAQMQAGVEVVPEMG